MYEIIYSYHYVERVNDDVPCCAILTVSLIMMLLMNNQIWYNVMNAMLLL